MCKDNKRKRPTKADYYRRYVWLEKNNNDTVSRVQFKMPELVNVKFISSGSSYKHIMYCLFCDKIFRGKDVHQLRKEMNAHNRVCKAKSKYKIEKVLAEV